MIKRLLLAIPLLWHLTGVAGLAAMVCAPAVPMHCACCEGQQATPRVRSASVSGCPCSLAPKPRDVDRTAVANGQTASSWVPLLAAVSTSPTDHSAATTLHASLRVHSDLSPPYLTAAPPRC